MPLQKVKPTSPGRRAVVKVVHPNLYKGRPIDALTESKKRGSGRNNNGHVTSRGIGGGIDTDVRKLLDRGMVDAETVTSQVQLILSRDLAREVIKDLNLTQGVRTTFGSPVYADRSLRDWNQRKYNSAVSCLVGTNPPISVPQ